MLTISQIKKALTLPGKELMARCKERELAGLQTADETHMLYEHWLYERGSRKGDHGFERMAKDEDLESVARDIGII